MELREDAGPEAERRDVEEVLVLDRERPKEAKRFPSLEFWREGKLEDTGGDSGGDIGPLSCMRRCSAAGQSVYGWICASPIWPQPVC